MVLKDIDTSDIVNLYQSGMTAREIAIILSCSESFVQKYLKSNNVMRRPGRTDIITNDIIRLYNNGWSVLRMAKHFGCARGVITKRLLGVGIQPRNSSEATRIIAATLPPEERSRRASAAHDAVRGKKKSVAFLFAKAQGVELSQSGISRIEIRCREMLRERGIDSTPQKAIGPYNVDLALNAFPIAVEIFGGGWHFSGRHLSRYRKRIEYLLNCGYYPIIILVSRDYPLEIGAIEYIISFTESLRRNEPPSREDWVIRGNGEIATRAKSKLNNGSTIS